MTRSLTRRILITSAALGTAVLAACSNPTAPQHDTVPPLDQERNGGGVYGGSSTKMCKGGGVYGGSSTC